MQVRTVLHLRRNLHRHQDYRHHNFQHPLYDIVHHNQGILALDQRLDHDMTNTLLRVVVEQPTEVFFDQEK
jgi:hypothetical protein